jgi:predicted enzyme related to lactoylglutathione lyase
MQYQRKLAKLASGTIEAKGGVMDLLVNIDVDDLEKAERFYCAAFGLHPGRRFGQGGVELLGSSAPIYLLHKQAGSKACSASAQVRSYERHWTPVHLDFVVDDVDAAVERFVAAGGKLEDPAVSYNWGRIAHLADPFGHGICLLQFLGRGYDEIAS